MYDNQPPYLHQRPAQPVAVVRQIDNWTRFQDFNVSACLFLLVMGLLTQSFPVFCASLAYAGVWWLGVYLPSEKQYQFYLATITLTLVLMVLAPKVILCLVR